MKSAWTKSDRRLRWGVFFLLAILLSTAGCAEQSDAAQPLSAQPAGEIAGERSVGQTFVALDDGLSRIDVLLATYARHNSGRLVFGLRQAPAGADDLVRIEVEAATIRDNAYHAFRFDPIPDSGGRSFYFFLQAPEAAPGNAVTVWQSALDIYPGGSAVVAGQPQSTDLVFRAFTRYDLAELAADVRWGLGQRGWVLLVGGLLFTLPGFALSLWLPRDRSIPLVECVILSTGLSLAILVLLVYLAQIFPLRLGPWAAWGLLLVSALMVGWRRRGALTRWRPDPAHLALGIVFGLTLAVRLLAAADLAAPMWGDSYQHTLILQLVLDHGGLFQSWQPYAPLASFTYHFGFHAAAAFFQWLTGLSALSTVLWAGQMLNALAVLALYPLAVKIAAGNRWAGVAAVAIAGLFSQMPMYYVNWGRYTQLAGQVMLPVVMWLTWEVLERRQRDWRLAAVAALAVAGLALTHYRVLLIYAAFALALGLIGLWRRRDRPTEVILRLGALGGAALLITLPWLVHSQAGRLPHWMGNRLDAPAAVSALAQAAEAVAQVLSHTDGWLLGLAALGGLWSALKRQRGGVTISLWLAASFLLANLHLLGLAGGGIVDNFTLAIAAYIPLALLAGLLIGGLIDAGRARWKQGTERLVLIGVCVLGLWGGAQRFTDVEPATHALLTRQDLAAMGWIRAHVPPDARFLINSLRAYGGRAVVGSDGGWWLPLLTGRANTVPPLTYSLEQGSEPGYFEQVAAFADRLQGAALDAPETRAWLRQQGVTHVYIGQQQGRVNYSGSEVLDADALLDSRYYRPVYHEDEVWVFELVVDE
ncbi:MAG: DUF6541 family protein [Chloroflexota bacterium]